MTNRRVGSRHRRRLMDIPHLIWIAEMALVLPMPLPWVQYAQTEALPSYFYNPKTGVVRPRHPLWNRLLDMVHLHRSDNDPVSLTMVVNWHMSDRYEGIEAVKRQSLANAELQCHIDRVCKQITKGARVWRRRAVARHQQQRQNLLALRISIRSRLSHVRAITEAISKFQQRCHAALHSECDDYMNELSASEKQLQQTEKEIENRLGQCGHQFYREHYSESLRILVQQQIASSIALMREASRWMDRAREEMRNVDRDRLALKRKTRAVQNTLLPVQKALDRAESVQKDRLQSSEITIAKSIKSVEALKQSIAELAGIIDNEGFRNFCKEAVRKLEQCEAATSQNLDNSETHKRIIS